MFTALVVDADTEGLVPWLATAYVPGPSLAEGLQAIHAVGVVHRDLKPSNVSLAADGPRASLEEVRTVRAPKREPARVPAPGSRRVRQRHRGPSLCRVLQRRAVTVTVRGTGLLAIANTDAAEINNGANTRQLTEVWANCASHTSR